MKQLLVVLCASLLLSCTLNDSAGDGENSDDVSAAVSATCFPQWNLSNSAQYFSGHRVGLNCDGRMEVFAKSDTGDAIHAYDRAVTPNPSGNFSNWVGWNVSINTAPSVTRNPDGRLEAFVTGNDGTLYHAWQHTANGGWSSWSALASNMTSEPPTLGMNSNGHGQADTGIEVFDLQYNSNNTTRVWHAWPNANGSWGMGLLPEICEGRACHNLHNLSVSRNVDGRLELFAQWSQDSGQSSVVHLWQMTPHGGWTNEWKILAHDASGGDYLGAQTTAESINSVIHVFAIGLDGNLYESYQSPSWTRWTKIGGTGHLTGVPSAKLNANDQAEVFATTDSGTLFHVYHDSNGWHQSDIGHPSGTTVPEYNAPEAVYDANDNVQVFVEASNGLLYHARSPNWQWETPLTGATLGQFGF